MGLHGTANVGAAKSEEDIEDIVGKMASQGLDYNDKGNLLKKSRTGPKPYDAARTFNESNLTITHTNTKVKNDSLRLGGLKETVLTPDNDTTVDSANKVGVWVNPSVSVKTISGKVHPDSTGITTLELLDDTSSVLATKSVVAGDTFSFDVSAYAKAEYAVVAPSSDGTVYEESWQHTETTANATWSGYNAGFTKNNWHTLKRMEIHGALKKSGSALLEWSNPADVYEWNIATFTKTLDGESVDVFVAYDDGTGWTRTNGGNPISRNYSLADDANISDTDSMRFEVELARANTANDPRLDSAIRSWKL